MNTPKETPKQKSSTLTLRLTAEETAQLEHLKARTGRTTASDLIRYLLQNWESMNDIYTNSIRKHADEARKLAEAQRALKAYFDAYERLRAIQLLE